jgi:hypothetical protein
MTKRIFIFLLSLFFFSFEEKKDLFELEFIKYPKEIVITKGEKIKELRVKVGIRYKGEDILAPVGKEAYKDIVHTWVEGKKSAGIKYRILFLDKKGKVFFHDNSIGTTHITKEKKSPEPEWEYYKPFIKLFERNEIISLNFSILWENEKEMLEKMINNEELKEIVVHIHKIVIFWEIWREKLEKFNSPVKIKKPLKIKIRVKYER